MTKHHTIAVRIPATCVVLLVPLLEVLSYMAKFRRVPKCWQQNIESLPVNTITGTLSKSSEAIRKCNTEKDTI